MKTDQCVSAPSVPSAYLDALLGKAGDVFGQQDEDGCSVLLLGLEVFLCGEVGHLHDHTAAGQNRLVGRARLRHHDGPAAACAREGRMKMRGRCGTVYFTCWIGIFYF